MRSPEACGLVYPRVRWLLFGLLDYCTTAIIHEQPSVNYSFNGLKSFEFHVDCNVCIHQQLAFPSMVLKSAFRLGPTPKEPAMLGLYLASVAKVRLPTSFAIPT